MDVALIPPRSLLEMVRKRPFQMAVPEALKRTRVRDFYRSLRSSYVILDNGMFESGEAIPNEFLFDLASQINANELVMPDAKDNMEKTLELINDFLNIYDSQSNHYNLMATVQVHNLDEVPEYVYRVLSLMRRIGTKHITFGLPRRMTEDFGPGARIMCARTISDVAWSRTPIHLLGLSRAGGPQGGLNEVRYLAHTVRSVDTSAPFVWAQDGLGIGLGNPVERKEAYFNQPKGMFHDYYLRENVRILDSTAAGLHG